MILLDTNACISLLNDRDSPVLPYLAEAAGRDESYATSTVVAFELRFGAAKSELRERNAKRLDVFFRDRIQVLPFDLDDSRHAGSLRALLESQGRPIGPFDTLIAGQALRRDATLLTANIREFSRVPGLRVIDWSAS